MTATKKEKRIITANNLDVCNITELRTFCKENKIKGYIKLNYFELVNLLRDFFEGNPIKHAPQPEAVSAPHHKRKTIKAASKLELNHELLHKDIRKNLRVLIKNRIEAGDKETLSTLVTELVAFSLDIEDFLNVDR